MDYPQALKNPGKMLGGVPEALEASAEFSAAQKRANENMPGPESDLEAAK